MIIKINNILKSVIIQTDFSAPLRSAANSVELLETDVIVISKKSCRKRWDERYHFIINDEMICTKDSADDEPMSAACAVIIISWPAIYLSGNGWRDVGTPVYLEGLVIGDWG